MTRAMLAVLPLALALWTSQVPVEQPPESLGFRAALEAARAKRPRDERPFLAVKQGPVAASLAADLQRFDWLLVGSWSYPEKKWSPGYSEDQRFQHDLLRVRDDGAELRFSFVLDQTNPRQGTLTHVNFDEPPPTSVSVAKVAGATYLQVVAYGQKELHRVVSYDGAVLVVDLSFDGKPASKKVKFRDVRVALPRLFVSRGK